MGDKTSIEWTATVHPDGSVTPGATWNPVRGCTVVSPGCANCYAAGVAARFSGPGLPYEGLAKQTRAGPVWTGKLAFPADKLDAPLRWKKPRRIFVNSMADLFHPDVPATFIAAIWARMAACQQHTFQILTKRSERMAAIVSGQTFRAEVEEAYDLLIGRLHNGMGTFLREWPLPGVWLGTSVEDQRRADERIPWLLKTPAVVRFLSCEPLLGPITLSKWMWALDAPAGYPTHKGPDWVIVGGESGPRARPMQEGWALDLLEECRAAGVAAFAKQLGSHWAREHHARDGHGGDPDEWPAALRVREFPTPAIVAASS